jgi:undecaprenyl-diphosphatase
MLTLTYLQAIILGAVQGITELFPVSSLGHSVILPSLLGWNIDQGADFFLIFLVATHFATALVLFIYFWKDWKRIILGLLRSIKHITIVNLSVTHKDDARLGWLLVVGTVPAGILGLLFQNKLQALFASPKYVSIFLICNGLVLFAAEYLRKKKQAVANEQAATDKDAELAKLTWTNGFKVGIAQALALIPGFSRTGSALGGGLLVGLDHEEAARFAFLLATPIIGAAAVLKLPHFLLHIHSYPAGPIFVGAIAAAICAYFSVKFLLKYFKTKTLTPFAIYCILAGAASAAFFFFMK